MLRNVQKYGQTGTFFHSRLERGSATKDHAVTLTITFSIVYTRYILTLYSAEFFFYHTSNSHERMGVNRKALQLCIIYEKPYFFTTGRVKICIRYYNLYENSYQYYKSHENSYQVLQVTLTASESLHSTKLYRKYHAATQSVAAQFIL